VDPHHVDADPDSTYQIDADHRIRIHNTGTHISPHAALYLHHEAKKVLRKRKEKNPFLKIRMLFKEGWRLLFFMLEFFNGTAEEYHALFFSKM
jgi:hypothetical protein